MSATPRDRYDAHMTQALEPVVVYAHYRELCDRGWYQRRRFGEIEPC
jgi:hypothetical protein